MIELKGVRYAYPQAGKNALDGVSAICRPGRCLMVTGPSGSGKTTLCLAAAGILRHEYGGSFAGGVTVAGKDIGSYSDLADIARVVGISFDDPDAQLIFTTVEEEVLTALECRGLPPSEVRRRLEALLAETRLASLRNRAPHTLSGGQKQRLVLAATLALGTDVLILDEPTSELDDQGTAAIVEILKRLKDQGRTILLVEHKWNGLASLVDDLLVLEGGRVTAAGTPAVVLADPAVRSMLVPDFAGVRMRPAVPPGPPIIQATDLVHRYGEVPALQGISLEIRQGEFVALVGENGSGKTTLIKHFNGLLKPTAGRVVVNGVDTRDATVAELSRHVGLVFQNPDHMFFRDTVREEVAFGPENLGIADLDAAIDRALRQVHLDRVQHLYPRWLSRGERQRLAIACILAMQPPVIALDEPTTGLDAREAREIMTIARDLQAAGHTIVMITHSRDIALACTDRIVTLAGGTIASDRFAGAEGS